MKNKHVLMLYFKKFNQHEFFIKNYSIDLTYFDFYGYEFLKIISLQKTNQTSVSNVEHGQGQKYV